MRCVGLFGTTSAAMLITFAFKRESSSRNVTQRQSASFLAMRSITSLPKNTASFRAVEEKISLMMMTISLYRLWPNAS